MKKRICRTCKEFYIGDGRRTKCETCRVLPPPPRPVWVPPTCTVCAKRIKPRDGRIKMCPKCLDKHPQIKRSCKSPNEKARIITKCAVKVGFLPHPRNYKCVDCGDDAICYDHRDYNKPLEVVPVCLPCNTSRGRGIPLDAPRHEYVFSN